MSKFLQQVIKHGFVMKSVFAQNSNRFAAKLATKLPFSSDKFEKIEDLTNALADWVIRDNKGLNPGSESIKALVMELQKVVASPDDSPPQQAEVQCLGQSTEAPQNGVPKPLHWFYTEG